MPLGCERWIGPDRRAGRSGALLWDQYWNDPPGRVTVTVLLSDKTGSSRNRTSHQACTRIDPPHALRPHASHCQRYSFILAVEAKIHCGVYCVILFLFFIGVSRSGATAHLGLSH